MNKSYYFFIFLIGILSVIMSCSQALKIDIVRSSSELNHCELAFGPDLASLKEENAMLLQTGVIDTTDEQAPIPVAIVVINKSEVLLKLIKNSEIQNETFRTYTGEGYTLNLSYKKSLSEFNESIFNGKILILKGSLQSEYDVVGSKCNL